MRIGTLTLFDETISGTSTLWYTPASTYDVLGRGDLFAFGATVYNVTGVTPTLTVQVEHSADGQNWTNRVTSPEIGPTNIANASNTMQVGAIDGWQPVMLHFVRLRMQLGGTSRQRRLKLTATTRGF